MRKINDSSDSSVTYPSNQLTEASFVNNNSECGIAGDSGLNCLLCGIIVMGYTKNKKGDQELCPEKSGVIRGLGKWRRTSVCHQELLEVRLEETRGPTRRLER